MLNNFTNAERDACLPIIDFFTECTRVARRQGVLALEEFALAQDNDFLKFAMMLVVDGIDPALVKGMLETLIGTENHSGQALLERVIITEGALSVQAGESPRLRAKNTKAPPLTKK
jgi:flagellar motor component MotA